MYNILDMFSALARFAGKYKILIIVFWVALAAIMVIFAPSLSKVGVTDDAQFLPKNTESSRAQELLTQKFGSQGSESTGSALIVVYNHQGLSSTDLDNARSISNWLLSHEAPQNITSVTSIFQNEASRSILESQDQTTTIIRVGLSKASSSAASRDAMTAIQSYIQTQSFDTHVYITGDAGVSSDILISIQQTINKATLVTVALVFFLLLLIYRSPVAILVPLITIGVSYLISRGIAGYIAGSGVSVSSLVDAYLVVTLFGIGTDYCLFLVSRFKEDLVEHDRQQAGELALKRIGPVILASAATVIVALLCLGISRFGMNRTSGLMLAIGVAITLLAGLTLTPALISFFGCRLLWPAKLQNNHKTTHTFWNRLGRQITQRPIVFIIPIVIILALPYVTLSKITFSASLLDQMPQDISSVQGYQIVKTHFPPGEFSPASLLIEFPDRNLSDPVSFAAINQIAESLKTVSGVSRVQYFSEPYNKLLDLSQQSQKVANSLNITNLGQLSLFQTLGQNILNIAVQYPGVTTSSNFQVAVANLTQISKVVQQIDPASPQDIPGLLIEIKQAASGISLELKSLADEFILQGSSPFVNWLKSSYFSRDSSAAKIDIYLNTDPFEKESITTINSIHDTASRAIQDTSLAGASLFIGGTTAQQSDILAINNIDFLRVLGLAVIGIFLVTVILLRSIIAPFYMIVTVIFNFGATMGIATWLFLDVLNQNNLIYMLPIFVFVILIAVGSDYNIFLVSRIREESQRKPLREAICHAVSSTGGVITSCGIILAGTFATLTSAPLQMVYQVGASIAIGVIIDTFLVRAVLIPSIASLVGRWNWWPSRISQTSRNDNLKPE